jgi:hypothetical protein
MHAKKPSGITGHEAMVPREKEKKKKKCNGIEKK